MPSNCGTWHGFVYLAVLYHHPSHSLNSLFPHHLYFLVLISVELEGRFFILDEIRLDLA